MVLPFISISAAVATLVGQSPTTMENHAILLAFEGRNVDGRLGDEETRRGVDSIYSRSRRMDIDGDGLEETVTATYVSPDGTPAAAAFALVVASRPNGLDDYPIVPDYVTYGFEVTTIGAPGIWHLCTPAEQIMRKLDELVGFAPIDAARLPAWSEGDVAPALPDGWQIISVADRHVYENARRGQLPLWCHPRVENDGTGCVGFAPAYRDPVDLLSVATTLEELSDTLKRADPDEGEEGQQADRK